MNQLLKEFISYILEVETAAQQAKKAGYKSLGGGYWSKSGDKPAEATTRGGQFRKLTAQEKKKLAQADAGQRPTPTQEPKEVPTTTPTVQDKTPPQEPGQLTVSAPGGIQTLNSTGLAQQIRTGIVAPGNDFSRYSEAVSIFMSKYIVDNPDASDEEIMQNLVRLDCDSKTLSSKVTSTIPRRFAAQYKQLKSSGAFRSGCATEYSEAQDRARFMTMIVAKAKAQRMATAIERTGLRGVNLDSFSGDQVSLSEMKKIIEQSTGKFYSETGKEISKDEMLKFINGFGTAKFPADTALVGRDTSGNVIFIGFSDKKDLNAIINNSTVTKEIERTQDLLENLKSDGKITEEQHAQLKSDIGELSRQYEDAENELKEVTSSPATRLVEIAETNPRGLREYIKKAKNLSKGSDPAKYWNERIGKFQKAATKKATSANEQENLQWLRKAGWDGKSTVSDEMALTAFAYKSQSILSAGEEDLPKDDQEILFRLGIVDPKEMVQKVGEIRKRSLDILTQTRVALDQVKIYDLPLGTFIDGVRAWKGLHLDMGDYDGTLSMVAEDNVVDYESIEQCLGGLSSIRDFTSNLQISTRDIKNKEYGITTGATVEVFSVTPTGDKVNVGVRNIRSKDGILGRLQTTWTYHPEFQDCLASKKG
jgi:hypothetical protein